MADVEQPGQDNPEPLKLPSPPTSQRITYQGGEGQEEDAEQIHEPKAASTMFGRATQTMNSARRGKIHAISANRHPRSVLSSAASNVHSKAELGADGRLGDMDLETSAAALRHQLLGSGPPAAMTDGMVAEVRERSNRAVSTLDDVGVEAAPHP